ncbi:MAG: hypothetical protein J2P25_04790, partial [Nocardiopsaceae bacterium]|nr:hypothetical protein [Nocardiopsaceae bacterium]
SGSGPRAPVMEVPVPNVPILAAAHTAPHPMSTAGVILWLAIIAFACAGAYWVSIRRHPYRACSKCGESGKHRGTIFPGSFRACTRCGGTGRRLRPFAKHPGTSTSGGARPLEPRPDRIARRQARQDQARTRDH